MPQSHIVDYVFKVAGRLIVHRNPTPHKLKLSVFQQLKDFRFFVLVLFCPPNLEKPDFHLNKFNFYLNEFPVWVFLKFFHIITNYFAHIQTDQSVVVPVVVFSQGYQPPQVVVAVRHQVDFDVLPFSDIVVFTRLKTRFLIYVRKKIISLYFYF